MASNMGSRPDQIIKVKSSKKYNVKIQSDSVQCIINGICETSTGEFLITDNYNFKVKLLDKTYNVIAYCDLPSQPWSICRIDDSLVAVTMHKNEVHFIRVSNKQLIKDRILKLQHSCMGIAHQYGNLYITDGEALYLYSMEGRLVSKMYGIVSGWVTVTSCAVSPDGERIYVTNDYSQQLVTLSRNGTVISTQTILALSKEGALPGLHVTDSGQVLVCGYWSNTIYQVDRDGRQKLTEVVTHKDGVTKPASVYFSKHTCLLIVGMVNNENIIVFNTQ